MSVARGWNGEAEVGLQVPNVMFKSQRDEALKDAALRLLDQGYRPLLREAYNLAPGVPADQKLRPGFEAVGPEVKAAYTAYLKWYQKLRARENGTLEEAWASQLGDYRGQYDQLRARVGRILQAGGRKTESMPGANLYQAPKHGETWSDWLSNIPSGFGTGMGLALAALVAAFIFTRRK